jgi:hypothetical protein
MSVQAFLESLIAEEPKARHSIQLELDTGGDVPALFEVLLTIMTGILRTWYQPPINLSNLQPSDHAKLVAYFASFGYGFHLDITEVPRVFRARNRDYLQQNILTDMTFQMTNDGQLYTVHFSILPVA